MKESTSSKDISLKESEMLLLRGTAGTVAIVKAGPSGQFFFWKLRTKRLYSGWNPMT
ncbi:hypothetical protein [Methanosarcina barkeri]|uniref:hypothetical protein n=1 Tax=Methanosarcina barkeri TaxID=2208 RepID=UPI000A6BADEF|nr:hypothetical protein [Methanosarcina barkeri]